MSPEKGNNMTLVIIISLVAALGIMVGFAARQMQDLRESDAKIEDLRGEIENMRGKPSVIEEQAYKIEEQEQTIANLRRENASLNETNAAHVSSLEMLLDHADESA